MNKFIRGIVGFSLKNRFFIFFMTALQIIAGVMSYKETPLEAFPDVTNTQIIIVTQWNGRSAEEIERFVTVPIEVAMNSVQQKTNVRSTTMFGLSIIKIIFDDTVEDFFARQQVNNLLRNIDSKFFACKSETWTLSAFHIFCRSLRKRSNDHWQSN